MVILENTALSDLTVTFATLPINDNSALTLECIVYGKGWVGLVSVVLGFAVFSKFAPLTLANFEKGCFCLII